MRVIAIIPARSGSKGLPHKNIRPFLGKPLMVWSIEHAFAAKSLERVIVSTDSEDYADIAKHAGAFVFHRSPDAAADTARDYDVCIEVAKTFDCDLVVYLRPTCPIREPGLIDRCIDTLGRASSLITVSAVDETPWKAWFLDIDGDSLIPVAEPDAIAEPWGAPRQLLPTCYRQNGCVDVVRADTLLRDRSMFGPLVRPLIMDRHVDIDTEADWLRAEEIAKTI